MPSVATNLRVGGSVVLAGVVGKIVWDIRYGRADPEVAKARRVIFNSIKKKFYKVLLLTGGVIAGLTAFRGTYPAGFEPHLNFVVDSTRILFGCPILLTLAVFAHHPLIYHHILILHLPVANHVVDAPASTATDVAVDATGVPIVQIETVEVPHQQHY
jgi:hypothetical protein